MDQINAMEGTMSVMRQEKTGIINATSELQTMDTSITNRVHIMENWNVPVGIAGLHARVEARESEGVVANNLQEFMKEEVKHALAEKQFNHKQGFLKGILESKAIWGIRPVGEAKHYRNWNKKFKNAIDQAKPGSRYAIIFLETVSDKEVFGGLMVESTAMEAILEIYREKGSNKVEGGESFFKELSRDLWAILQDKAEGDTLENIHAVKDGEGLWAYVDMHNWFHKTTDLGMTDRRIEIISQRDASMNGKWQDQWKGGKRNAGGSRRKMEKKSC